MMEIKRLKYLDGLRGLASFFVLLYHFFLMDWIKELLPPKAANWISIFFNGTDCVSLFFVLSGLVLALPYVAKSSDEVMRDYPRFFFSRVFRLMPIYWITFVLTFFMGVIPNIMKGTIWVDLDYNWITLRKEFLMIRGDHNFYVPGWSLEIELLIGAFVPFIALLNRHKTALFLVMILCTIGNPVLSVHILAFILGGWLAQHFSMFQQQNYKDLAFYRFRYIFYIGFVFLFSFRHIYELTKHDDKNWTFYLMNISGVNFSHLSALASLGLLIWLAMRPSWQRVLSSRFFVWLGNISYCLYLLHWLVVFAVVRTFWIPHARAEGFFNWQILGSSFILAIGLSLLLAHIFHFYIEKQLINYFKKQVPKMANWWTSKF